MAVFVDEQQISMLERFMKERGYLEANYMATSFNMLRANDLIWSFVINNYLLGRQPIPFDLLYWNSDATRMPAAMHSFYLRNMYHENNLAKPGGITLSGVPIDLRRVTTPSFLLSTREDHIAPWRSTYAATRIYSAPRSSFSPRRGTSLASSTPRGASTVIGKTTSFRGRRMSGSKKRRPSLVPGGRRGTSGFPNTRVGPLLLATRVQGNFRPSRMRQALTCGFALWFEPQVLKTRGS